MASWGSFWYEHRFELSGSIFAVGVVLMFITVIAYAASIRTWAETVPILHNLLVGIGPWIFWEAIIAVFVLLFSGFYFMDTLRKGREFERLIRTNSKEMFLKNRRRMENLALVLPGRYARRVEKKRAELKVRD